MKYSLITIEEARKKSGLSKKEMSVELGVKGYVYNLLEKYKRELYVTEAIQFAKVTKTPLSRILFTIDDFTQKSKANQVEMELIPNFLISKYTLKQARSIIDMTSKEVAQLLEYTPRNYIEYENYRREFKVSKAIKFSEITGVPIQHIIFKKD